MTQLVAGFDTSAYTTSCALCDVTGNIAADARQLLTVPDGDRGLRQSEAVFQHLRNLPVLWKQVMAQVGQANLLGVCASVQPLDGAASYMPVFVVGKSFASTIATSLGIPFFETTHQRGHLAAARIGEEQALPQEYLAVHLSGGTNQVLLVKEKRNIQLLADSGDISAGQLLDRLGVKMGFPFPAGAAMETLATKQIANLQAADTYPVAVKQGGIHFSGAESMALRDVSAGKDKGIIAAALFDAIARGVVKLLLMASEASNSNQVLITGGVASSNLLRELLLKKAESRNRDLVLHFGQPRYAGDNAAGVALIGLSKL